MSKTRQGENIWNKSRNLIAYYKSRRENGPHLPVDVSVQQASWKWIYHVQIDSTSDILFTMSDRTSGKSCVEEWLFQPSINCNELMLEIVVIVLEIYILNIIRNSSVAVNLDGLNIFFQTHCYRYTFVYLCNLARNWYILWTNTRLYN